MIYLNMILIAFVICFIIDYSGFIDEIDKKIGKIIGNKLFKIGKPFSCSLCMTWWISLIYGLLSGGNFFLVMFISAILGIMTNNITRLIYLMRDILGKIIEMIERKVL